MRRKISLLFTVIIVLSLLLPGLAFAAEEPAAQPQAQSPTLTGIQITNVPVAFKSGYTQKLGLSYSWANGIAGKKPAVTWKSSNTSVLVISKYGTLRAKLPGKATITAKSGGCTSAVTIEVAGDKKLKLFSNGRAFIPTIHFVASCTAHTSPDGATSGYLCADGVPFDKKAEMPKLAAVPVTQDMKFVLPKGQQITYTLYDKAMRTMYTGRKTFRAPGKSGDFLLEISATENFGKNEYIINHYYFKLRKS